MPSHHHTKTHRPVRGRDLARLRENITEAIGEETIVCLECGRQFRLLATHLLHIHDLTSDEYRERWGYNSTQGLCCKEFSEGAAIKIRRFNRKLGRKKLIALARKARDKQGRREPRRDHRKQSLETMNDASAHRRKLDRKRAEKLYKKGVPIIEIGRRLGCADTSVAKYLKRVRLHEPDTERWSGGISLDEILELVSKGLAPEEIAEKRGLNSRQLRVRISRYIRKHGLDALDSPRLRRLRKSPVKAVHDDHHECLICGSRTQCLSSHVTSHGLTMDEYRSMWGYTRENMPVSSHVEVVKRSKRKPRKKHK